MKVRISILILFLITIFSSCFDTLENGQIVGPYFINAIDIPENMCIVFNEKEDYSGGSVVVLKTVFEIEWNDKFIIAKQHPANIEESIEYIYSGIYYDSLKLNNSNQNIGWIADSLSKQKYGEECNKGIFMSYINKNKNDVTFYYLINTQNKSNRPLLLKTKEELDSVKLKFDVGNLINKRYFDYLD